MWPHPLAPPTLPRPPGSEKGWEGGREGGRERERGREGGRKRGKVEREGERQGENEEKREGEEEEQKEGEGGMRDLLPLPTLQEAFRYYPERTKAFPSISHKRPD